MQNKGLKLISKVYYLGKKDVCTYSCLGWKVASLNEVKQIT